MRAIRYDDVSRSLRPKYPTKSMGIVLGSSLGKVD
jgi:hypothetical protein